MSEQIQNSENIKSFQSAHPETEIRLTPEVEAKIDAASEQARKEKPAVVRDEKYWLSLEQWSQDPEFKAQAEKEFMSSPLQEEDGKDGWARREFLKLMGASLAMSTAACVRRPVEKIVPYNKQPEEVTHAVANYYTSTYSDGVEGYGVIVKTKDGRPIKIEGNPSHPLTKGGTSARAQAHILSLYDPERLKKPTKNLQNKERTNRDSVAIAYDAADAEVAKQLAKGGVIVFTGAINSPSTRALVSDFCQGFSAQHIVWEPLANESLASGQEQSYGAAALPFYRFDQAHVIVSIDADFLGTWMNPTVNQRQFSSGRKDFSKMNRMISFDSTYSLTAANADVRVKIKPSQQLTVVMGLLHEIVIKKNFGNYASNSTVKTALEGFANAASELGVDSKLWSQMAEDLIKASGKSLIVSGGIATQHAQAKELQLAVNFLNTVLGNDGETVDWKKGASAQKVSSLEVLQLIEKMNKGEVKTLILHRANPLYTLPASFGFKEAMNKVEMVISTADRLDETAKQAHYVFPDNHAMEGWGDFESAGGYISLQQPTMAPLYDTRSFQLSLMTWAYTAEKGPSRLREPESFYQYLQNFWKSDILPKAKGVSGFNDLWETALQKGFIELSTGESTKRSFKVESLSSIKNSKATGYEVVLHPTIAMTDGSQSNISWLQELPDPVTKICWDNYASISIATAEKLKAKEGHLLAIEINGVTHKLPAHIQPGLHDDVIAIQVGYGRTAAGKVGNGVGYNSFEIVQKGAHGFIFSGLPAQVSNLKGSYQLANPQGHHTMEGRKIVVEATLAEYLKDPAANNHKHKIWNIWSGHQYNGHKWGMAIDLNSCTGCNACNIACQAENNIPVVGKKYVIQGREMAWIRIDRYYVGDPENAEAVFQPIMCQHCDNAPCETVCPVLATVHSSEGTNDMAYNRCVGTRYCSNNCPYKVRRFNWFDFTSKIEKPLHLAHNPDVSVRPRGVMEKCTFCVQRIKVAKNSAKLENRKIKDGDVKTACQTACPTDAIVFGDMNDAESYVSKVFKEEPRAYALLEEFHAAPAVRYMTKIRNNYEASRGGGHDGHAPAAPTEGGHS